MVNFHQPIDVVWHSNCDWLALRIWSMMVEMHLYLLVAYQESRISCDTGVHNWYAWRCTGAQHDKVGSRKHLHGAHNDKYRYSLSETTHVRLQIVCCLCTKKNFAPPGFFCVHITASHWKHFVSFIHLIQPSCGLGSIALSWSIHVSSSQTTKQGASVNTNLWIWAA